MHAVLAAAVLALAATIGSSASAVTIRLNYSLPCDCEGPINITGPMTIGAGMTVADIEDYTLTFGSIAFTPQVFTPSNSSFFSTGSVTFASNAPVEPSQYIIYLATADSDFRFLGTNGTQWELGGARGQEIQVNVGDGLSYYGVWDVVHPPMGLVIGNEWRQGPSPVPLPAALPMLIAGLAGLGGLAWRGRRAA